MKQGWSRVLKVILFLGRRLGGGCQPLLASGLLLPNKNLQFFSPVNGSASSAPIGAYPIEVPNADQDAELFAQCCLALLLPSQRNMVPTQAMSIHANCRGTMTSSAKRRIGSR